MSEVKEVKPTHIGTFESPFDIRIQDHAPRSHTIVEAYHPTRREMFVMAAMGAVNFNQEGFAVDTSHIQHVTRAIIAIQFADAVMQRLDEEGK